MSSSTIGDRRQQFIELRAIRCLERPGSLAVLFLLLGYSNQLLLNQEAPFDLLPAHETKEVAPPLQIDFRPWSNTTPWASRTSDT